MAPRIVIALKDLRGGDRIWLFGRLCDVIEVRHVPELPGTRRLAFRPVGHPGGEVFSSILPAGLELVAGRLERCFPVTCLLCRAPASILVDVVQLGWPRRRLCARCAGDDREILLTDA